MAKQNHTQANKVVPGSKRSIAIGTWKNPGAPGAYSLAPARGKAIHTNNAKKGGKKG